MRTISSSFTDTYEDAYYFVVDYPEQLVFADSDSCQVFLRLKDSENVPESGSAVVMTITETSTGRYYQETRYTGKTGIAVFDIARYLQILLGNIEEDGSFDYSNDSQIVNQKAYTITLHALGVNFFSSTLEACSGRDRASDKWWSKPRRFRWWSSYPFTFDYPNVDEASITIDGGSSSTGRFPQVSTSLSHPRIRVNARSISPNGKPFTVSTAAGMAFHIAKSTDTGHVEGSSILKTASSIVSVSADGCNADRRAIYLRWLNEHGELMHWLFYAYSEKRTTKSSLKRKALADRTRYVECICDDGRVYSGVTAKELSAYSDYLKEWEYQIVATILSAPFVDMLDMDSYIDESKIRWFRCRIKDTTLTRSTRHRSPNDNTSQIAIVLDFGEERSIGQ